MPHCCCELKFSFGNSEYPFLSECVSLWVRVDTDVAWRIWQLFRWIRLKLSQVEERKTSRQLSWKVNSICSTSSFTVSHRFSTECTMLLYERANRRVREYVCVCVDVFSCVHRNICRHSVQKSSFFQIMFVFCWLTATMKISTIFRRFFHLPRIQRWLQPYQTEKVEFFMTHTLALAFRGISLWKDARTSEQCQKRKKKNNHKTPILTSLFLAKREVK